MRAVPARPARCWARPPGSVWEPITRSGARRAICWWTRSWRSRAAISLPGTQRLEPSVQGMETWPFVLSALRTYAGAAGPRGASGHGAGCGVAPSRPPSGETRYPSVVMSPATGLRVQLRPVGTPPAMSRLPSSRAPCRTRSQAASSVGSAGSNPVTAAPAISHSSRSPASSGVGAAEAGRWRAFFARATGSVTDRRASAPLTAPHTSRLTSARETADASGSRSTSAASAARSCPARRLSAQSRDGMGVYWCSVSRPAAASSFLPAASSRTRRTSSRDGGSLLVRWWRACVTRCRWWRVNGPRTRRCGSARRMFSSAPMPWSSASNRASEATSAPNDRRSALAGSGSGSSRPRSPCDPEGLASAPAFGVAPRISTWTRSTAMTPARLPLATPCAYEVAPRTSNTYGGSPASDR